MVAKSISSAGISKSVQREIAKLGSGSIVTPTGYLAFVFIFFVLAVSLFACAQIGAAQARGSRAAARDAARPAGRAGAAGSAGGCCWRACAAAAISLAAGLLTWAGADSRGVSISLPRMLEAGANCLPVALLFLGIAALAYAIVPRASAGIAYGLVAVAFLWYLVGSLLGAPKMARRSDAVRARRARAGAAVPGDRGARHARSRLAALAVWAFRRRDLAGCSVAAKMTVRRPRRDSAHACAGPPPRKR